MTFASDLSRNVSTVPFARSAPYTLARISPDRDGSRYSVVCGGMSAGNHSDASTCLGDVLDLVVKGLTEVRHVTGVIHEDDLLTSHQ